MTSNRNTTKLHVLKTFIEPGLGTWPAGSVLDLAIWSIAPERVQRMIRYGYAEWVPMDFRGWRAKSD